jgi:outer membrane protein
VLELQEKLSEAEAAEIRARADYNKAVAEYYRQTGTTLREYGAVVE